MNRVLRTIIIALLAAGIVMALNLKGGGKAKPPTDTAVVQTETTSTSAADKPEPAKPDAVGAKTVAKPAKSDKAEPAKPAVKAEEPEKKPEAAKPDKPAKTVPAPAKPKGLPKIVDIGGDNCIPCKLMVPILDGLRSDYKGKLEVVTISKDKDPDAMKRYKASTIPTQIIYDANGREAARHFGFWAKDEILAALKSEGIDL